MLSGSQKRLLEGPRRGVLSVLSRLDRLARSQRLAALWISGSAALLAVTLVCLQLGFNFVTAAFACLIVVVLLSLLDTFVSSLVFGVVATACLTFFFVAPAYSFRVDQAQDLVALAAFLVTSLALTALLRRVRDLGKAQREDAYAALEQSERRYRDAFRYMPMGLAQIDATGLVQLFSGLRAQGVTDLKEFFDEHPEFVRRATDAAIVEAANDEAIRMFGGKNAAEMLGPTTRYWEASFETVRRSFEERYRGEEFFQVETKMSTIDGRVIDVIFATGRIGAVANRALAGFIDITARVRAQEMLHRVQADFAHAARVSMLGELTASIAHEVNQPLAAISVNGEASLRWLNRDEPNLAEARQLAQGIVANARRASEIIARIRTMATRQTSDRVPLLLDDVVREALLFLRHEVQTRAVTVTHYPAPGAVQVVGDRTQLQQVIVNLLVNSMQAMAQADSPRRKIAIRTVVADPATLCCTVEDSGPGIDSEHLARLFESFFTTKDSGMGMGLPICRSIVEAHGGRITVGNDAAEGGARFAVMLPVATSLQ